MKIQKYEFIKNENDNTGYYVDSDGNRIQVSENTQGYGTDLYFDTEKNEYLQGKEKAAYIEYEATTLSDEDVDKQINIDQAIDEGYKVDEDGNIIEEVDAEGNVIKQKDDNELDKEIKEKASQYQEKINYKNNDIEREINELISGLTVQTNLTNDELNRGFMDFNLDKTKVFQEQKISSSMFQNAVEHYYLSKRIQYVEKNIKWTESERDNKNTLLVNQSEFIPAKEVLSDDYRDLSNTSDEVAEFMLYQKTLMTTLLGNGNPQNSFVQFLDKKQLKDGIYVYDKKAIDSFVKSNFITSKNAQKFISDKMRAIDFKHLAENFKKISVPANIEKEDLHVVDLNNNYVNYNYKISYCDDVEYITGKKINSNNLTLDQRACALANYSLEKGKNVTLFQNKELLGYVDAYKKIEEHKNKRSFFYPLFHPIEAFHTNILQSRYKRAINNALKDPLLKDTPFVNEINKLLKLDFNSKEYNNSMNKVIDYATKGIDTPMFYAKNLANTKLENVPDDLKEKCNQFVNEKIAYINSLKSDKEQFKEYIENRIKNPKLIDKNLFDSYISEHFERKSTEEKEIFKNANLSFIEKADVKVSGKDDSFVEKEKTEKADVKVSSKDDSFVEKEKTEKADVKVSSKDDSFVEKTEKMFDNVLNNIAEEKVDNNVNDEVRENHDEGIYFVDDEDVYSEFGNDDQEKANEIDEKDVIKEHQNESNTLEKRVPFEPNLEDVSDKDEVVINNSNEKAKTLEKNLDNEPNKN